MAKHLTLCALALAASILAAAWPLAAASSERLVIRGLGDAAPGGVFDPSLTADADGRLWMSYSAVQPSPRAGAAFNAISTRIAYSDDGGRNRTDAGVVNRSTDVRLPPPHDRLAAKWEHEVSRLAFDPWAPEPLRWKLLWHRYLRVYDGRAPDSAPLFEHGWIDLKTASGAGGPWSAGRKVFAGALYNSANDTTIGRPEMRLDRLYPGSATLGSCLAFTEPGMLVVEAGVYVSLKCAAAPGNGRVVLLRCDREFRECRFLGIPLHDRDAPGFGQGLTGFSASDLVEREGRVFLVVTPTRPPGETYQGCLFLELESLDAARLVTRDGRPVVALELASAPGSFNGACGYHARATDGAYLGQHVGEAPDRFRILKTGRHPR